MYATFNRFQLQLTKDQALSGSHQGDCYEDCKALAEVSAVKKQLDHIPAEDIKAELSEYGAWDDGELSDEQENRIRLLWIACGDIVDDIRGKDRH